MLFRSKETSHERYFELRYGTYPPFEFRNWCVCGVEIKENCYITDDDVYFLVIGNCCIKRFLPKENSGRTCSNCKKPHRNTKDNFCKDCRPKKILGSECEECGERHNNRKDNLCNNCRFIRDNTKKCECGKRIDKKYKQCYVCSKGAKPPTSSISVGKRCAKCSKAIADKYRYCYGCYSSV